jgi:NAD(P)H-dependent flavin oxidoreductase YrpB (nitropropane dioxygenase family)
MGSCRNSTISGGFTAVALRVTYLFQPVLVSVRAKQTETARVAANGVQFRLLRPNVTKAWEDWDNITCRGSTLEQKKLDGLHLNCKPS